MWRPASTVRPSTCASQPTVVSSFTLSYTVADKAGNQASAFLDVRIVPADEVNRPPIARTDIARTRSGVPVIVTAVANDSDPDGDIIAVESIRTQPSGGTAAVSEGAVVYTPSDTFVGTDRLTYSLVDAGGEFAVGEVLIGVMPAVGANRAPEAFDDDVQAVAGSAPLVYDVLANDSDADGDTLNVTTVGTPSSGGAAVAEDGGAVVFTPPVELATGSPPSTSPSPTRSTTDAAGRRRQRCRCTSPRRRSRWPRSPSTTWSARSAPGSPSTSTCSATTSIPTAIRPSSSSRRPTRRSSSRSPARSR